MSAASPVSDQPLYGASPWEAYRRFWERFAVFSGRAGRAEYWWPVLLNTVVLLALGLLLAIIALLGAQLGGSPVDAVTNALLGVGGLLVVLFVLAQIVPSIAVAVRRLHDVDLSGWLVLVALVPSVGGLVLLILHVLPANPAGRRYDRGALAWTPAAPPVLVAASAGSSTAAPFDSWPAPEAGGPVTAPVPVGERLEADRVPAGDEALRAAWSRVGEVSDVQPPMSAPPAWRRQGYLLVSREDGTGVLATDGLSRSEGAAALGTGAEVHLAGRSLHAVDVAERWELAAVAAVARRISASGMHLPSELEQYGTLSMTLPGVPAPDGLRTADGALGVLVGLPAVGLPESVPTEGGEVRLVGITPLTPDELQQILEGGAEARARIAGRLASLPPRDLLDRG